MDSDLAKILELGAPSPQERLETMKECKKKKFLTGIAFIPVLPFLSDSERNLDMMIRTAKEYGADYVFVGALTLFGNNRQIVKYFITNFLNKIILSLCQNIIVYIGSFLHHLKNIKKNPKRNQRDYVINIKLKIELYSLCFR